MTHRPSFSGRQGTVLIVVSGITALMGMLALSFLIRMRADALEATLLTNETRARVMFASALQYINETSRIGWDDDPTDSVHKEAYGWQDVRTGAVGPRDQNHNPLFIGDNNGRGTVWPAIGSWTICDAKLWRRPPTAITPRAAINPIRQDPSAAWSDLVGYPNLDPQPLVDDPNDPNRFTIWLRGQSDSEPHTDAPCWFRVYRKTPTVFIITCGGGSSGGYRTWAEVQASPDAQRWIGREDWELARQSEPILWYEVAWTPAVNSLTSGWAYATDDSIKPAFISAPMLPPVSDPVDGGEKIGQNDNINKRNQMGTFLYHQRLEYEPANW